MPQARFAPAPAPLVELVADEGLAVTALAALAARGLEARRVAPAAIDARAGAGDGAVVAWVVGAVLAPAAAAELAAVAARLAGRGRPPCVLAPPSSGHVPAEHAAALALLRAHGAAVVHDVDAWLEGVVLLARFGMPAGPRVALVAPAGSWLEAQGRALAAEATAHGGRAPLVDGDEPTDVVLHDADLRPGGARLAPATRCVPVVARGELLGDGVALVGLRAALAAAVALGRAGERVDAGLGPEPRGAPGLAVDQDRLRRQLDKLASGDRRLGDHETKVLLAAYGVPITRQAVATTPSAAVRVAQRAGFPVELKPWGHDVPSEAAGCPVERDVRSAALVRRAFTAVLSAAGRPLDEAEGAAVIVREAPPPGREVAAAVRRLPSLGWTVILDVPGAPPAAAPAPLRPVDADALAGTLAASRAGEGELDRDGLSSLLRRASHLVAELDARLGARVRRLDLSRIVVGGRGARALVVDAALELDG